MKKPRKTVKPPARRKVADPRKSLVNKLLRIARAAARDHGVTVSAAEYGEYLNIDFRCGSHLFANEYLHVAGMLKEKGNDTRFDLIRQRIEQKLSAHA